jgi:hypothetical protein
MKNTDAFTPAAEQWIARFDQTARRAIDAWREGGERLGEATRGKWDSAFEESSPKLSEETRRNAARAQQAFAGCYARGVDLSATGATFAVDRLVEGARSALERAGTWRAGRA